jgi:NAD(P)-dependent dehydrogenase (short-subunit alcohol dehydrogenase family)
MSSSSDLTNIVALVTGANRGIGFETARELGERGATVVLGARELASGETAAHLLRARGWKAQALRLDVTKPEDHASAYQYLLQQHGRLDILVNNAGILCYDNAVTASPSELRRIFETNFFGVVGLTQALLPLVRKSAAGRIVNLSSILGSLTLHSDPSAPIYTSKVFSYNASKTALNAFTVHLAYELRDTAIKVNSADPGWVKTAMGGAQAPLEVSEGGGTSVRLATLPADGPSGGFMHLERTLPW